jgi:hypothetical protein
MLGWGSMPPGAEHVKYWCNREVCLPSWVPRFHQESSGMEFDAPWSLLSVKCWRKHG